MRLIFAFFLLFVFGYLDAQVFSVNGLVVDTVSDLPIPFFGIQIKNTTKGVISDENGIFKLSDLKVNDTLLISALGYQPQKHIVVKENSSLVKIYLKPTSVNLNEVLISSKKEKYKFLGTSKFSVNGCSAFSGDKINWRGEQAAIKANNKPNEKVLLQSFSFYIIKNLYPDSLTFRLMLYKVDSTRYPAETFLNKAIIFSTPVKQGEVLIDLIPYQITYTGDFFISLECLENEMESSKFCFAGSVKVPSYTKLNPYGKWKRTRGGGADLCLKARIIEE